MQVLAFNSSMSFSLAPSHVTTAALGATTTHMLSAAPSALALLTSAAAASVKMATMITTTTATAEAVVAATAALGISPLTTAPGTGGATVGSSTSASALTKLANTL